MKKQKQPGENISLKTKKNESAAVMAWINGQSNLMDSIRYLIENEIRLNGIRNLQHFIPSDRPLIAAAIPASLLEMAAASEPAPDTGRLEAASGTGTPAEVDKSDSAPGADDIDDEDIESWL